MKQFNLAGYSAMAIATLAACSGDKAGEGPDASVDEGTGDRSKLEESTNDRVINATDFDNLQLGARIEGPVGTEVNASFLLDGKSYGDIESYVACPVNINNCDPASLPGGTIYTYVHVVTPGVDESNDKPFEQPTKVESVAQAKAFRMSAPSTGFSGGAGYSLGQARAAGGPLASFTVKCEEDRLVFDMGSGEAWATGEPITFYWKSTVPPKGPGNGYALDFDGKTASAQGPVPGAPPSNEVSGCS